MRSPNYVLHGTSSGEGAKLIQSEGFNTKEGWPNVSENLIYALKWATDKDEVKKRKRPGSVENSAVEGRIILIKVPEGIKVGYGDITEMVVDDETSQVTGHVKNYVSGRNQLAFRHLDEEEEQQPRKALNISNENIVLSVKPSAELRDVLKKLGKDIKSLEKIDIAQYTTRLADLFSQSEENKNSHEQLLPIIESLVTTTVESEVVMMMRKLELNTLRAKGYETFNNDKSLQHWNYMDRARLWDRLQEVAKKSDTISFGPNSAKIRRFIKSGAQYLLNALESD